MNPIIGPLSKGGGKGEKGKKGFGKGKPDSASSVNETKIALQRAQEAYNDAKQWSSEDQVYWTNDHEENYYSEYPRQQHFTPDQWEMYGPADYTEYEHEPETEEYSGNDDEMNMAVEAADRANPPRMGRIATTFVSKKLSAATSLKECCFIISQYIYVPVGCKIDLIPVDSACTVTNIDHESVIPADRRMTASRPLYVAKLGMTPLIPTMRASALST